MLQAILYLRTLSHLSIFIFCFACALKTGLYDVIIHSVRLTQIFGYSRLLYKHVFKNCYLFAKSVY